VKRLVFFCLHDNGPAYIPAIVTQFLAKTMIAVLEAVTIKLKNIPETDFSRSIEKLEDPARSCIDCGCSLKTFGTHCVCVYSLD